MSQSGSQDRTERATPKRLREARQRGEVARSRELSSLVVVGGGIGALLMLGGGLAGRAADWMRGALGVDATALSPQDLATHFGTLAGGAFLIVLPLLAVGALAGLGAPLLLGGWNLSAQALKPDFGRIDPFKGLGRLFSGNSLVELLKALLKAGSLGAIAAVYIASELDALMQLGRQPLAPALAHGGALALGCLAWMAAGLLAIALVDAPWQLWSHARKLRMTRQEVRQEFKESEGSPEVKGRLRRLQQELAQRQMMEAVPTADVIVTNPTHYAVALKYEAAQMRAPRVVAKGADLLAANIRELAGRHRVPVVSAPPLARALYRHAGIGDEIPANLYAAVAQVLTYIYQLRDWGRRSGPAGARPAPPVVGEVPGGEADLDGRA